MGAKHLWHAEDVGWPLKKSDKTIIAKESKVVHVDFSAPEVDFSAPEVDFSAPEVDFSAPELMAA